MKESGWQGVEHLDFVIDALGYASTGFSDIRREVSDRNLVRFSTCNNKRIHD